MIQQQQQLDTEMMDRAVIRDQKRRDSGISRGRETRSGGAPRGSSPLKEVLGLARDAHGFVGADLAALCHAAASEALQASADTVALASIPCQLRFSFPAKTK